MPASHSIVVSKCSKLLLHNCIHCSANEALEPLQLLLPITRIAKTRTWEWVAFYHLFGTPSSSPNALTSSVKYLWLEASDSSKVIRSGSPPTLGEISSGLGGALLQDSRTPKLPGDKGASPGGLKKRGPTPLMEGGPRAAPLKKTPPGKTSLPKKTPRPLPPGGPKPPLGAKKPPLGGKRNLWGGRSFQGGGTFFGGVQGAHTPLKRPRGAKKPYSGPLGGAPPGGDEREKIPPITKKIFSPACGERNIFLVDTKHKRVLPKFALSKKTPFAGTGGGGRRILPSRGGCRTQQE